MAILAMTSHGQGARATSNASIRQPIRSQNSATTRQPPAEKFRQLTSAEDCFWIFRIASAICSISSLVPSSMVWVNQTASLQS